MGKAVVTESKLTAIGNGVRHVTGGSGLLTLDQMATTLNGVADADMTSFIANPPFNPYKVSWSTGSWEDIATMLSMHYAGDIDITDYWHVGDVRAISLSAMEATDVGESHVAQDVELVLMDSNHYDMSDNSGKAAFVIGQKDCLSNGTTGEIGYINSTNVNAGGWDACARRTWCNSVYKAALPSNLQALIKQVNIVTSQGSTSHTSTTTSQDYVFLEAEKEVFGSSTNANSTAESSLIQYAWYADASNRIKKTGASGSACIWHTRSPYKSNATSTCVVNTDGTSTAGNASTSRGIAPCFCI